jgi:GH43 family beta-xylosidase
LERMQPRYRLNLFLALALWLVLQPLGVFGGMEAPALCFTNPIVQPGPDPFVVWYHGFYYFTCTEGAGKNQIRIREARSLAGLQAATPAVIWRAPEFGPDSRDIWAPELHLLQGHWYVYFAGTSTNDPDINRRMFVLESRDTDPMGPYTEKARLGIPGDDHYAIDGTVLQQTNGSLYFIWSGRAEDKVGPQNLYIARMSNPWTLVGPRVKISSPEFAWEKKGWAVNEGPAVLQHNQTVFVTYSASGGTTPDYCLGLLTITNGDFMNPSAWRKSPQPVFASYSDKYGKVFTVGHNNFFTSPDGREEWIIYLGKENEDGTWKGRSARAQQFFWSASGEPVFGHPVPAGVWIALPSGEWKERLPNVGGLEIPASSTNKR